MVSGSVPQVLLLGPAHRRSRQVCNLLRKRGLSAACLGLNRFPDLRELREADVLVCTLDPQDTEADAERLKTLLDYAHSESVPVLVWGADKFTQPDGQYVECLSADVGLDEVIGRLTTLAHYAPVVKRMEQELGRLQRLGRHLNRYFEEIDQELRLAGRLQRDFLPRDMPDAGLLKFSQLYRPAGWVSGDIFDVFRVDQQNIGMFIADAMGHGTAAGLMSMFLRRTLVLKQGRGDTDRVLTPAEVLRQLHEGLVRQDFPCAHFVTAAFVVIDVKSLGIRLARGGHPYPLHVNAAGEIREMRCEGGLLGVPGLEPEFDEYRGRLARGDKVILYTDGLEDLFIVERGPRRELASFTEELRCWARLDADTLVTTVGKYLDRREGSLNPADDVTVVVAEVVG